LVALRTANAEVTRLWPVKTLGDPADVETKNETPDFNANASSSVVAFEYGIKLAVDGALKGNTDKPLVNTM
jgi:hypothetical protein